MKLCVADSSVAFKWYRQPDEEEWVPQAVTLLESHLNGELEIHIPDLLIYEIGNILRFNDSLALQDATAILRKTYLLQLAIHAIDLTLAEETLHFARKLGVTFYDAAFVALSNALACTFVTADRKLFTKIKSLPSSAFLGDL